MLSPEGSRRVGRRTTIARSSNISASDRDGSETALSREHPRFRVALYFGFHPPTVEEARAFLERQADDD